MPKFVVEREMPGIGSLSAADLLGASRQSCAAISKIGPAIQWVESFITDDKVYSIFIAPDELTVREHARKAGLPVNRVSRVRTVADPTIAEAEPIGV